MPIKSIKKFNIDCTGNACVGDEILFTESVFGGSHRKPVFLGERRIAAEIVKDSYGVDKQQHTFSLRVIGSDGYDVLKRGAKIRRKGRNVYRNQTLRLRWNDESERKTALEDKYDRGAVARENRNSRKGWTQ